MLTPHQELGLAVARADLGYVRAAVDGGDVPRSLAFFQHAVLVAYEAEAFCVKQLAIPMPTLTWDVTLAGAFRVSNKFFDDKQRSIEELAREVGTFASATRTAFTGGWGRVLARKLGIFNPDLAVISLDDVPIATNVNLAFYTGLDSFDPGGEDQMRPIVFGLGEAVGQMVVLLGAAEKLHQIPGDDGADRWSWRDGDSVACYEAAFAGEVAKEHVPLMLMLQGASAIAHLATRTACCAECRLAAFKHRLVVAHHVARSLEKLIQARVVGPAATSRIESVLAEPGVGTALGLRSLRNGLVHLGLSDVPIGSLTGPNPMDGVVRHYTGGLEMGELDRLVHRTVHFLCAQLTSWLLEPPAGAAGFADHLRVPAQ